MIPEECPIKYDSMSIVCSECEHDEETCPQGVIVTPVPIPMDAVPELVKSITHEIDTPQGLQYLIGTIVELRDQMKRNILLMGQLFHLVREYQLWRHLPEAMDFKSFCKVALDFSHKQVLNYINIYETFGQYDVNGIPMNRLELLRQALTKKQIAHEDMPEWIDTARVLSQDSLISEIAERNGDTPPDSCEHAGYTTQTYAKCDKCGHKWEIKPDKPEDNF